MSFSYYAYDLIFSFCLVLTIRSLVRRDKDYSLG